VTAATLGDTHITVIADPFDAKAYLSLFLEGVATRIQTGMAVRTFLCERLGLNPSCVSEQITTVFLNGSVVEPETLRNFGEEVSKTSVRLVKKHDEEE